MSGRKNYKRTIKSTSSNPKISNPNRRVDKSKTNLRSNDTINRIKMYNAKAIHARDGTFLSGPYMSRTPDEKAKRIEPNRRWFENTRTVSTQALTDLRDKMETAVKDPYTFVKFTKKLPMALLTDPKKTKRPNLLTTETFEETFSSGRRRKKPRLAATHTDESSLADYSGKAEEKYAEVQELHDLVHDPLAYKEGASQKLFEKGQSRRIWSELFKVIDSSDVVVQVVDVRDPMGTRSRRIEAELKKPDRRHKHMVIVLNKCDLVPTWVTRRWVKLLSQEYPTLAFHASITNPFGKGSLIALLRQFGQLHKDKKQISVGFVGYPNVGKSSIINTLRSKKVCTAAPIPGETRVWRYVTLFKRIFLIDCPGTVFHGADKDEAEAVLKGVVRVDNLKNPEEYVAAVLQRCKREYLVKTYGVYQWEGALDFLEQFARRTGKMLRGNEPDMHNAARIILNDFQRGRLPYFQCPPFEDDLEALGQLKKEASGPQVAQLFNKINVKLQFSEEDMKPWTRATARAAGRTDGRVSNGALEAALAQQMGNKGEELKSNPAAYLEALVNGITTAVQNTPASDASTEAEDMDDDDEKEDEETKTTTEQKSTKKTAKKTAKKSGNKDAEAEGEVDDDALEAATVNGQVDWDLVYADTEGTDLTAEEARGLPGTVPDQAEDEEAEGEAEGEGETDGAVDGEEDAEEEDAEEAEEEEEDVVVSDDEESLPPPAPVAKGKSKPSTKGKAQAKAPVAAKTTTKAKAGSKAAVEQKSSPPVAKASKKATATKGPVAPAKTKTKATSKAAIPVGIAAPAKKGKKAAVRQQPQEEEEKAQPVDEEVDGEDEDGDAVPTSANPKKRKRRGGRSRKAGNDEDEVVRMPAASNTVQRKTKKAPRIRKQKKEDADEDHE